MKAKTMKLALIISLATFLVVFPAPAKAQTTNRMLVSPDLLAPTWGESHLNFTVEIKIEMSEFMDSYQIYLLWDPALFKVSHGEQFKYAKGNKTITEGAFLKNGTTNYPTFFTGSINNTAGVIAIWSAQITGQPYVTSVTGNGTLFTVIFEATGTGQCPLHFNNTQIMLGASAYVLHTTADGYFNNQQYPITAPDMSTHDIFIESNSTVTDFGISLTGNLTYFNVTGLTGTAGYLNVTIPKYLLDADPGIPPFDWIILLDNAPVAGFTKTANDTHTFIYFDYAHSQHNVLIKGNRGVIPEYPIALISLISLAVFTSLALLTKRFSTILKPRSLALKLK